MRATLYFMADLMVFMADLMLFMADLIVDSMPGLIAHQTLINLAATPPIEAGTLPADEVHKTIHAHRLPHTSYR